MLQMQHSSQRCMIMFFYRWECPGFNIAELYDDVNGIKSVHIGKHTVENIKQGFLIYTANSDLFIRLKKIDHSKGCQLPVIYLECFTGVLGLIDLALEYNQLAIQLI